MKVALFDHQAEQCPQCKKGYLVIRQGKLGPFKRCSGYPDCDYSESLRLGGAVLKVMAGQPCPLCGHDLVLRQGKFGLFIGCSQYPTCHHIEQIDKPDDTQVMCPQCQKGHLVQRRTRTGRVFYACANYPTCRFALNFSPLAGECPTCHYPVLFQKKVAGEDSIFCANKQCGKKIDETE